MRTCINCGKTIIEITDGAVSINPNAVCNCPIDDRLSDDQTDTIFVDILNEKHKLLINVSDCDKIET